MPFLRQLTHLLPSGAAWRITVTKTLRKFFEGLAEPPATAREFIDEVYLDLYPASTRELEEWESQFGLEATGTEAARRLSLAAAWAAQGGQDPRYLQDTIQAAGFPLYLHEWWESGPPYVARDPRTYTTQPLIGTVQCDEAVAICGEANALCNAFLVNDPGYLVNKDLTPRAPPPVPDDPDFWPHFLYWGGATFPDRVLLPLSQKPALEKLLLKLCPAQQWLVMLVDYDPGLGVGVFDDSFDFTFA